MNTTTRLVALACIAGIAFGACGSSYKGLTKADFSSRPKPSAQQSDDKLGEVSSANTAEFDAPAGEGCIRRSDRPARQRRGRPALGVEAAESGPQGRVQDFADLSTGVDQAAAKIKSLKSKAELAILAEPPALKSADAEAKAYGLGSARYSQLAVRTRSRGATKNRTRYTSALMSQRQLLIGGEWVDGADGGYDVINPATEEIVGIAPEASSAAGARRRPGRGRRRSRSGPRPRPNFAPSCWRAPAKRSRASTRNFSRS